MVFVVIVFVWLLLSFASMVGVLFVLFVFLFSFFLLKLLAQIDGQMARSINKQTD